jgi:hypothetical protein
MPDPVLILKAVTAAAVTAAAVLLICGLPWRAPRPARASAGAVLGVGLGFCVGCWLLGVRPHWPPREDQDRLLLVLLPALLVAELLGGVRGRFRWAVWALRLVVAAAAARVLLHNTSYLEDLTGPGTREWTPAQAWLILGGLALVLAGAWGSLALLARQPPGRSAPLALALACAGAAVTVMLSGYASGGQLGLPLAGALAGAAVAALALGGPPELDGLLGLGVVGLYGLLVIGHFFGQLATSSAALLFAAPLLCWIPELPYVRRLGPRLRGLAGVVLAAVPVVVVLTLAQHKFVEDSARKAPMPNEPSFQDYLDYGK